MVFTPCGVSAHGSASSSGGATESGSARRKGAARRAQERRPRPPAGIGSSAHVRANRQLDKAAPAGLRPVPLGAGVPKCGRKPHEGERNACAIGAISIKGKLTAWTGVNDGGGSGPPARRVAPQRAPWRCWPALNVASGYAFACPPSHAALCGATRPCLIVDWPYGSAPVYHRAPPGFSCCRRRAVRLPWNRPLTPSSTHAMPELRRDPWSAGGSSSPPNGNSAPRTTTRPASPRPAPTTPSPRATST